MTSHRERQREEVRYRVLRLLEDNPEMSQRHLAEAVGVSVGGIHYLLAALVEKGFVKMGNFKASRDKRRYAYLLTPKGVAEKTVLTRRFLARKRAEYAALRTEIAVLSAEVGDERTDGDADAAR